MAQAASEMLGPQVSVRTEAFPDDQPEVVPPPERGSESAVLSWDSPRHEHARLRLCRARDDCLERWVSFEPSDPDAERGRTLGFLAAAVVLETTPRAPAPVPAAPAKVPPSAPVPSVPIAPVPAAAAASHTREFPRGEISAAAAASGPGTGTTLGASLAADYALTQRFRIGLAGELRFGEVADAQASSRIGSLVVRTSFVPWRPSEGTWVGFGLGVGLYQLAMSHFSSDDAQPDRQDRFLLGGTWGALAGVDLNKTSSFFVELAAEVLSGKTTIYVHEEPRATWPLVNPLARLGLRAAF
jgi:hypothetical protein